MPQTAKPAFVLHDRGYSTSPEGVVRSPIAPRQAPYVVKLEPSDDPMTGEGHVLRYSAGKTEPTGARLDLRVELWQGYQNEDHRGRLIAEFAHENLPAKEVEMASTLTPEQANAISDYSDLALRFVFSS